MSDILRKIQLLRTQDLKRLLNTTESRAVRLRAGERVNVSLFELTVLYDYLEKVEPSKRKIKSIREQLNEMREMNLTKISQIAGISYPVLWSMVNEVYNPNLEALQKLINAGLIKL